MKIIAALVLLLSLCACGDDGDDSSAKALDLATKACNAWADTYGEADALARQRARAADVAAKAAVQDHQWDGLADVTGTWASWSQSFAENLAKGIPDMDLASEMEDMKSDLSTQCRKVNAAGGKFDVQDLYH